MTLALGLVKEIIDSGLSSASGLGQIQTLVSRYNLETVSAKTDIPVDKIKEIAKEFADSNTGLAIGGSVSSASDSSTKTLVAINLLNYVAGNIGKTINFNSSHSIGNVASYKEIESLVQSMSSGDVDLLITYDTNPVYSLPKSLWFDRALQKVSHVVSFSSHPS